jgi:hypothetical protein
MAPEPVLDRLEQGKVAEPVRRVEDIEIGQSRCRGAIPVCLPQIVQQPQPRIGDFREFDRTQRV